MRDRRTHQLLAKGLWILVLLPACIRAGFEEVPAGGSEADSAGVPRDGSQPMGDLLDGSHPMGDLLVGNDLVDALPSIPDGRFLCDADTCLGLLFEDFEDGIHPPWTLKADLGDQAFVSTDAPHGGNQALRCITNEPANAFAYAEAAIPPSSAVYLQWYVRLAPNVTDLSDYVMLASLRDAADKGFLGAGIKTDRVPIINGAGVTYSAAGPALQPGTWHKAELLVFVAGFASGVLLWVDDELSIEKAPIDLGPNPAVTVSLGITWQGNKTEPIGVSVDDILVVRMPPPLP